MLESSWFWGGKMLEKRRNFLISSAATVASLILGSFAGLAQSRKKSLPDPPTPGDPQQRDKLADPSNPKTAEQSKVKNRERQFREDVDKLVQVSNELREELNTAPAANVLSVKMYKRVQEIAKLAKQMESTLKG
jgi:hypothetical protein